MRSLIRIVLISFVLSITCSAQNSEPFVNSCKVLDSTSVSHKDGVEVRTVRFVDTRKPDSPKDVSAHVYIPDSEKPLPGIIFSHSSILADDVTTDLKPFAFALARGGVASIMLDREIKWKPLNDEANQDASVGDCAAIWLLENARLDANRLMRGGTRMLFQSCSPKALNGVRWCGTSWLNFGETSTAEYHNTESFRTLSGRIALARFVTSTFKLPEIQSEWLGDSSANTLLATK